MVFQMIPPVRVKICTLLAGEFMILIPSITVSRFAATHICTVFLNVLRYAAILWGVGPNVTRYFD